MVAFTVITMKTDIENDIQNSRGLILKVVSGFIRRPADDYATDDLYSAALVGLWKALQQQPRTSTGFVTFASGRMRAEMIDWLRMHNEGHRRNLVRATSLSGRGLTARKYPPRLDAIDEFNHRTRGIDSRTRLLLKLMHLEGLTQREAMESMGYSESLGTIWMQKAHDALAVA